MKLFICIVYFYFTNHYKHQHDLNILINFWTPLESLLELRTLCLCWTFQHDTRNSSFKFLQVFKSFSLFNSFLIWKRYLLRFMLSRKLIFFTSSYHCPKTMQLFILESHCRLFSWLLKKHNMLGPSLCFYNDFSSWSVIFLPILSCAEIFSVFSLLPL